MLFDKTQHLTKDILGLNTSGNMNQVTFPGMFINHGQHFQSSAPNRTIMNEIPGPHMPSMVRLRRQPGGIALSAPFWLSLRHTKPKLPTNRLNHSLAHLPTIIL